MGTSAFDLINNKPKLPEQQQNKNKSAFDAIDLTKSVSKTSKDLLGSGEATDDSPDTFGTHLGNFIDYVKNIGSSIPANQIQLTQTLAPGLMQVGTNIKKTIADIPSDIKGVGNDISDAIKYYKQTPISKVVQDAQAWGQSSPLSQSINNIPQQGLGSTMSGGFSALGKGLIDMAEKPISTLTATKNEHGMAVPATPEEEALNMQGTAALAAQIATFGGISKATESILGTGLPTDLASSLQATKSARFGPLAISAGKKQAFQQVFNNTIAGGVSGALGGSISSLGQDNMSASAMAGALSFAPLSAALSIFGIPSRINKVNALKGKFVVEEGFSSAQQIAAVNALKIDPNANFKQLADNVSQVSTVDNTVQAAIRSKLDQGDGYIVEGVSPELGAQLHEKLNPSLKQSPPWMWETEANQLAEQGKTPDPGTAIIPAAINGPKPKPYGVDIKFDSPFDKVAYLFRNGKTSSTTAPIIDDILQKTGLTRSELQSHGQYVSSQIKDAAQSQKLTPRTQPEIDALNNAALETGKNKISTTPIGGLIQDNTGVSWKKINDTHVASIDPQTGQYSSIQPIDENNTLIKLGRPKNDNTLYQPYIQLPQQDFTPNYNRGTTSNVRYYYSNNGNLLVTSQKFLPPALAQFKETGFLPREIVSYNGQEVRIDSIKDGKLNTKLGQLNPSDVRRTNNSLQVENNSTLKGVSSPTLTSQSYLDNLYNKFSTEYLDNISSSPKEFVPYSDFMQRFMLDNGIGSKDINNIHNYFINKLGDDLANKVLSPEEAATRREMQGDIIDDSKLKTTNYARWISNQAQTNGLFFNAEGAGKYRLRWIDGGGIYKIVSTPEEALKSINEIRQLPALDKDGGMTGSIPTDIANLGGLSQQLNPEFFQHGKFEDFLDRFRGFGTIGTRITHFGDQLKSIDNLIGTNLYPGFLDQQHAQFQKRLLINTSPGLKLAQQKIQAAFDLGKNIDINRRELVSDNIETQSIPEITENFIPRTANNLEIALSKNLVKSGDVGKVKQLLYETKMSNPNFSTGSANYLDRLLTIGKNYPNGIVDAAKLFAQNINKYPSEQLSGPLVMKLADAYEEPATAMNRSEHANWVANNTEGGAFNPLERKYQQSVEDAFSTLADVAGIDPKARIQTYLPNIYNLVGTSRGIEDTPVPEEFARELSRVGMAPDGSLVRDPNRLLLSYFNSLANHLSGMPQAINKFQDVVDAEMTKFKDSKFKDLGPSTQARIGEWLGEVQGYPSPTEASGRALNNLAQKLKFSNPNPNSALSVLSLSMIAGKPILAIRDFHNIMGHAYIDFGHEFANEAFTKSISPETVRDLIAKGEIPSGIGKVLVDPSASNVDFFTGGKIGNTVQKLAQNSFNLSGQEMGYEHANAGIYQGSLNIAAKYLNKVQDLSMSKEDAYSKMGVNANYGPQQLKYFDQLVSEGKIDDAATFYARTNMRRLSHVYGFNNQPLGWSTGFGRLLGQYGNWAVNATSTMLDAASRGSGSDIAGRVLRWGIFNKATALAGSSVGLNLASWQVMNPLTALPTVGPIPTFVSDMQDDYDRGNLSMWKYGQNFIPWMSAAKHYSSGLETISDGNIVQGLGVAIGGSKAKP